MDAIKRYSRRLLGGDFSQGQAFWAILVPTLLLLKFSLAMLSLMNVISNPVVSARIWLPVAIVVFLFVLPLLFGTTLKAIWIAFRDFKGGRQSVLLMLATGWLMIAVVSGLIERRDDVQSLWQIAWKQDAYTLDLTVQDNRLMLDGALTYGSTDRVRQHLNQTPTIETLELNLSDGHLHEARALSMLITANRLTTEVRQECSGTCMLVLVGGIERLAWPGATLRFHRTIGYDNGYRSDWVIERERRADQHLYARRGVDDSYLFPIYYPQKNDDYLEPGLDVLRNTGVLTGIGPIQS